MFSTGVESTVGTGRFADDDPELVNFVLGASGLLTQELCDGVTHLLSVPPGPADDRTVG